MALYHFSVKQVSRGKGQTVVNSAAYISGQKLYNDYYGQVHDYTRKSGVMFTETSNRIMCRNDYQTGKHYGTR